MRKTIQWLSAALSGKHATTGIDSNPNRETNRLARAGQFLLATAALCFGSAALANPDLIVARSMPVTTGLTLSVITYDVSYKNGGPGTSHAAQLREQLPPGFSVLSATCVGAYGGAVCPTQFTVTGNGPSNGYPLISATIPTFPEFGVVRMRVQMQLPSAVGNYELSGTLTGAEADPIVNTNAVVSSIYVRPIVIDLTTSYSSNQPAMGGSNGLNGALGNVSADSDTIALNMPMSMSYRLENKGPDPAPSASFYWSINSDTLRYMAIEWAQSKFGKPIGGLFPGQTYAGKAPVEIVPMQCQAIGNFVCPAPVMYRVSVASAVRWLDHEPRITATPLTLQFPYAFRLDDADMPDFNSLQINPLFGRELRANDGMILTATLTSSRYGNRYKDTIDPTLGSNVRVKAFSLQDNLFMATSSLSTGACTPNSGAVSANANIQYVASDTISDANLNNNNFQVNLRGSRDCPQSDIGVSLQRTTSNANPNTVQDGDTFSATYTITNLGQPTKGVQIGTAFYDELIVPYDVNWKDFALSVSCTSMSGSPCPSQARLNEWQAQQFQDNGYFNVPMDDKTVWNLVIQGQAGTTACTPDTVYANTTWTPNLLAMPIAAEDVYTINNSVEQGTGGSFNFVPQTCTTTPGGGTPTDYIIDILKSPGTRVYEVGDRDSLSVRFTNNSRNGALIKDAAFMETVGSSAALFNGGPTSNTEVIRSSTSPGVYFRDPNGAPGLPLDYVIFATDGSGDIAERGTIDSGIVCSASAGASCPARLTTQGDPRNGYSSFWGTIPEMADQGFVTFTLPYVALNAATECVAVPNNQRTEPVVTYPQNVPSGLLIRADGTTAPLDEVNHQYVQTSTRHLVNVTQCPTGERGLKYEQFLKNKGTPTVENGLPIYLGDLTEGEVVTYESNITNTGTLPVIWARMSNFLDLFCRDGNSSGRDNPRCGNVTFQSISCTANNGASCPDAAALNAFHQALALDPLQAISYGSRDKWIDPILPVGSGIVLTYKYVANGLNTFTGGISTSYYGHGATRSEREFGADITGTRLSLPAAPGMALAKDVDKYQAAEGEKVTYTVDLTNGGAGPLPAGAQFIDPLPRDLAQFDSVVCTGLPGPAELTDNGPGVCPTTIVNNGTGISATLPEMLANTVLRFTITATAPVGGIITSVGNEARVEVPQGALVAKLFASANFAIPSKAEQLQSPGMEGFKSVRKPGGSDPVIKAGDDLEYTLQYANTGGMDVANFQITDALPAQVSYSGGASVTTNDPISKAVINAAFDGASNTALLQSGAVLGGGGVITVTIPVKVKSDAADGTTVSNQATAGGSGITGSVLTDNVDATNPACPATTAAPCLPSGVTVPTGSVVQQQTTNKDAASFKVGSANVPPVDIGQLTIGIVVDRASAQPGDALVYTLTVTNNGKVNANGINVQSLLPMGVDYVAASDGGITKATGLTKSSTATTPVEWTIDLAAGASKTLTINAKVSADTADKTTLIGSAGLSNPAGFNALLVNAVCTSDAARSCANTLVSLVTEPTGDVKPVPTLGEWAIVLLSGLVGLLALGLRRRSMAY